VFGKCLMDLEFFSTIFALVFVVGHGMDPWARAKFKMSLVRSGGEAANAGAASASAVGAKSHIPCQAGTTTISASALGTAGWNNATNTM
jgi:hypothetical protein